MSPVNTTPPSGADERDRLEHLVTGWRNRATRAEAEAERLRAERDRLERERDVALAEVIRLQRFANAALERATDGDGQFFVGTWEYRLLALAAALGVARDDVEPAP